MEILITFVLGFIYGWWLHGRWTQRIMNKLLEDPSSLITILEKFKQPDNAQTDSSHPLRVERHDDMIYLYNGATDEFLAQGDTLQEALDLVGQRFPDKTFKGVLSKEEVDTLGVKI